MKPLFGQTYKFAAVLILIAIFVTSCTSAPTEQSVLPAEQNTSAPSPSPLPAEQDTSTPSQPSLPTGQVIGKLVANGEPLSGVTVFIHMAPQEGAEGGWVDLHEATADEEGNFSYKNMAPGKYLLMFREAGVSDFAFKYVLKDGERYTFELPEMSGVDLGEVDATVTQEFP